VRSILLDGEEEGIVQTGEGVAPRAYVLGSVPGAASALDGLGSDNERDWECLDRHDRQADSPDPVTDLIGAGYHDTPFWLFKQALEDAVGSEPFVLSRFDVFGEFRYSDDWGTEASA